MKNENQTPLDPHPCSPEHGGNIYKLLKEKKLSAEQVLDFSANINPCGPPPWLRSLVNRELELICHYPDPDATELIDAISDSYQVKKNTIVPANGTTELLHLLPRIIKRRRVLIPVPSYVDYSAVFKKHGFDVSLLYLSQSDGFAIAPEENGKIQ